jgi:lactate racemase
LAETRIRDSVPLSVPYGTREARCSIPRRNLGEILRPNPVAATKVGEPACIEQALEHPIGKPRLEEAVGREDSVVLIVDDITRPTPVRLIVPEILKRLRASGIPDERVKIILALGTHRSMTAGEIRDRIGADIVSRIAVENHDFRDREKLVEVGESGEGIPIWINRSVLEATFRIGVGNIVPHGVAGWSGGGKIIYPGVAGERTVDGFHGAFGTSLDNRIGNVDSPIRLEIDSLVRHIGLEYIVNTILTGDGIVYRVVAGDYILAHRAGIPFAREVYSVRYESLADVAIVSSFPADIDFWQAGKAVYAGELLLRDGGTLILVTPCPERVAHNHDLSSYMAVPLDSLRQRMKDHDIADRSAAAAAIRIGLIRKRVKIMVVSEGLTKADIQGLGFQPAASLQEAVDSCLRAYGDGCRVSVLTHGGDLLPERA